MSYFDQIPKIEYEGPKSLNPLAFRWYQPDREINGIPMRDHFRFAMCWWHSFCGGGSDPFGANTRCFPWETESDPIDFARRKMDAAFEAFQKLGIEYFCFHDFDLVAEGTDNAESDRRLSILIDHAKEHMKDSGVKLLWGTANLFSHPRYMNGAITNPEFAVVAQAGAQVKRAIEATIELGGRGYVFWGGREGYSSLLNTDMKRELDHLGSFLRAARDYGRSQGFEGSFFIEPKPAEPSKHQYDFDAATAIGFLQAQGLAGDFKMNIEANHATLAGHSFVHELQVSADAGLLGSVDANRGDMQNGWDTDQFPLDMFELTEAMLVFLNSGGLKGGGVNFDAKLRRNSVDQEDLFIAHIAGMDAFARALIVADAIRQDGTYDAWRKERYASFDGGDGARFERSELGLSDLRELADSLGGAVNAAGFQSGKQEKYEQWISRWLEM